MQQARRKNSHLSLMIVIGMLTILMLILIAAIGIFLFTARFNQTTPTRSQLVVRNPLTEINVDQVDPALALASLGGVPEAEVIIEAINKDRPETALSAILFHPTLSDKESAGDFLLLAAAYVARGNLEKGIFSYQMAGTIATLSPSIPDTVRTDVFLQAGEAMLELNERVWAKFYLDQAFILASKSPFLQAAHRRSVFKRLQQNYLTLNQRDLARASLNLGANPPALTLVAEGGPILPKNEPIPLPANVQEAEANRWRKAQELAALLVERGGNAPRATQEALREALIDEDNHKLTFYEAELAIAAQISRKIDITVAKITWLSIKYRVARRAYGIGLAPEWETQAEQIRADLTKAYEALFALYADLIVALPEVSQIDKATAEKLRREVLAGELGRYPNYPEEQRRRQLLDATNQLILTQPEINIFVGVSSVADQEMYTLVAQESE